MQFAVKSGAPAEQRTACAIVPLFETGAVGAAMKELDRALGGRLKRMQRAGDARAKLGETAMIHAPDKFAADRVLLVGCGSRGDFGAKQLVTATLAATRALQRSGAKNAISYLAFEQVQDVDAYYAARLTVEAVRTASYQFNELKSQESPPQRLTRFGIAVPGEAADARHGARDGTAVANGADLARDLGNRPPNLCTPTHMAEAAENIAKSYENVEANVLDKREISRLGMGAFLSVTQGATEPPKIIVLQYRGAAQRAPFVLCGKGITFDTGGISLKPPPKMDEMKFDMCGGAGVIGAFRAIAELQPPINVVGIVPACENMPSGNATRPGDIVTSMSGQTIEILNTDAEGRLILCDALTYAKRFKPRLIVDVATLTGACVVALGQSMYTGVFSNDDELAEALVEAGLRTRDVAWRLPVDAEYGESLRSNFADFANSGAREGGASIAAQFLSRFVDDDTPWAHLDIAGTAWHQNVNKGATGRPVSMLVDFLLDAAAR